MDQLTIASLSKRYCNLMQFSVPETFKPTMKFFEVNAPADSQDAPGLKNVIFATFCCICFKQNCFSFF